MNRYTSVWQGNPQIVKFNNNDFAVVWESTHEDGSYTDIFIRFFNQYKNSRATEKRVNTCSVKDQEDFSITTINNNTKIIIAWESKDQDCSGKGIYGQKFNQYGVKVDDEFRLTQNTIYNQFPPILIGSENSSYSLVYQDKESDEENDYGVCVQGFGIDLSQFEEFLSPVINCMTKN